MLFSIFYNREINGIFKIGLNVFCFLYLTNSNSDFDIREKSGWKSPCHEIKSDLVLFHPCSYQCTEINST